MSSTDPGLKGRRKVAIRRAEDDPDLPAQSGSAWHYVRACLKLKRDGGGANERLSISLPRRPRFGFLGGHFHEAPLFRIN